MLLAVIVGDKHEGIGDDGSWDARGEATPESQPATLVPVDIDRTIDHSAVGDQRVILLEGERNLSNLKLCFDDVLRIRYEPGEEPTDTTGDELGHHAKVISAL